MNPEQQSISALSDPIVSHVAHELRAPLTAIKAFSGILLGGVAGELTEDQHKYQEIIAKNANVLQAMVDDLIEFTRLETGQTRMQVGQISIREPVLRAVKRAQAAAVAKGVDLSVAIAGDLPEVIADADRFQQILTTLIDNAIKFTESAGRISIHLGPDPSDGRFMLCTVADSGCGIEADKAQHLFERLYELSDRISGSRKGLGLGLYVAGALVEMQGGRIWVSSKVGEGSKFSFTLPRMGS